jgi:hypothetical protein
MAVIDLLLILFFIFLPYCICSVFIYLITLNALFILSMLSKLIVFKLGRMEPPHLMLEEEYNKDHHARYIEAAQVTKIVKKLH